MNVENLLQKLSFGPLSELAIAGDGSGVVPTPNIPKIILRVNNALSALYTRFPLEKKAIVIETRNGLWAYPLRREFAITSDSTEPNKFIIDSPAQPFLGDVLMVDGIANAENCALPFNVANDEESWHKVSYDTISSNHINDQERLFVHYRARHFEFDLNKPELETEIRIPSSLEAALLAHIAGNIYANMSMEGALAKAQAHLSNYENECSFHEERNTFAQWEGSGREDRQMFRRNGWA